MLAAGYPLQCFDRCNVFQVPQGLKLSSFRTWTWGELNRWWGLILNPWHSFHAFSPAIIYLFSLTIDFLWWELLFSLIHFQWPTKAVSKLVLVVYFTVGWKRQGVGPNLIPPDLSIIRSKNKQTKVVELPVGFLVYASSVMAVNLFGNWLLSLFLPWWGIWLPFPLGQFSI